MFFYGKARNKHFNGFLYIVYMNGKIIIPIPSYLLREFLDTCSSGWDLVVFISEEDDKVTCPKFTRKSVSASASQLSVFGLPVLCLAWWVAFPLHLTALFLHPLKIDTLSEGVSHSQGLVRAMGCLNFTGLLLLLRQKTLGRKQEFIAIFYGRQAGVGSYCYIADVSQTAQQARESQCCCKDCHTWGFGDTLAEAVLLPLCACSLVVCLLCIHHMLMEPVLPSNIRSAVQAPQRMCVHLCVRPRYIRFQRLWVYGPLLEVFVWFFVFLKVEIHLCARRRDANPILIKTPWG